MADNARPFLVVYILWHSDFEGGAALAEMLRGHFRRELYSNVAGGTGLSVIFRSVSIAGTGKPLPIDIDEAETTAIVVLSESFLANDENWVEYLRDLSEKTDAAGLAARLFPVAIERSGLVVAEQALRWDQWSETLTGSTLDLRLVSELTYEFCRMLRHYLERLKRPKEDEEDLLRYLQKVQIFLSHSKHDDDGQRIARLIREHLHVGHGLGSFFDVHDIPAGLRFHEVLLKQVAQSAVVAIHTDSYSSREWCRREIIEAKRKNVPLVVANCIGVQDERAFPYMGNVPIIRMDPQLPDRIDVVVGRLLDEVLKDFLWRCRIELERGRGPDVVFVPRTPELILLAQLPTIAERAQLTVVYPDPPLSAEEERLFEAVAPHVRLRSFTEWIAEDI